jgi:hypothetical protein
MRFGSAWPGANFQLVDKNAEITPDIHLIALLSDKPGTLELRELSLAINTLDGMVIVVGCSHPGIDKVFHPTTKAKEMLHFVRDWADKIPDELVIQCASVTLPDAGPVFAVVGCYHGDLSQGEKVLQSLRSFGRPVGDMFGTLSYIQMQSLFDPFFPPGRLTYVKSNFISSLCDEAIETLAAYAGKSPLRIASPRPRTLAWRRHTRRHRGHSLSSSAKLLQFDGVVQLGKSLRFGKEHSLDARECDEAVSDIELLWKLCFRRRRRHRA